jgi:hypothetical protein
LNVNARKIPPHSEDGRADSKMLSGGTIRKATRDDIKQGITWN